MCNYCNKHLTAKRSHGKTYLHKHLATCKRKPYMHIRQSLLLKEQKKANESSTFISNYTFDPEQSRKNLANMIIVHEYPLSMVKHLEFKIYSSGLQPFFKISSRNTINNDIMKIYEYEKAYSATCQI